MSVRYLSVLAVTVAACAVATPTATAQITTGVQTLETARIVYRMPVDAGAVVPRQEFTRSELKAKHNHSLLLRYPAGFKVQDCHAPRGFRCSFTDKQVAFSRESNPRGFRSVDRFGVTVRVPGIRGTYHTPALQTFSNGEEVLWAYDDEFTPAPSVHVEGRNRAPRVTGGEFLPIEQIARHVPCPDSVVHEAKTFEVNPSAYCRFAGFGAPDQISPAAEPHAAAAKRPSHGGQGTDELDGTARLVRGKDRTWLTVRIEGLQPGKAYAAHLHEGTCADLTSPHYRDNVYGPPNPPNELWPSTKRHDRFAGLVADRNGKAHGRASAHWRAKATARSVWIHVGHVPTAGGAHDHHHERLACADLS
jgi:hypothetical protein